MMIITSPKLMYIDNKILKVVSFPMNFTIRKHEMCWKLRFIQRESYIDICMEKSAKDIDCKLTEILIYDNI